MILTRNEIQHLLQIEDLAFTPELDKFQDQPHAIDLRLGNMFYLPKTWRITEKGREVITVDSTCLEEKTFEKIQIKNGNFFDLAPGESVIASTLEKIELKSDDLMGILYPRSSINRRGLSVDLTGIVDAHYSGKLMIPLLNKTSHQVIRLYPGERICQLVLQKLISPLEKGDALRHGKINAKYMNADEAHLDGKKDASEEMKYLKEGDLEALKTNNPY